MTNRTRAKSMETAIRAKPIRTAVPPRRTPKKSAVPVPKPLTNMQQLFVKEYLIDLNAKQAAIRAGYAPRSADVTACRMLRIDKIAAAVKKGMDQRSERLEITGDDVMRELEKIAFADIRKTFKTTGEQLLPTELDDATAGAVQSIEVVAMRTGEDVKYLHKIKLADKKGALELIAKHLGWFDKDNAQRGNAFFDLLERTQNSPLGSPQNMIQNRLLDG